MASRASEPISPASRDRIVAQPLGIVYVLVSRQATVYRLPQRVGEGELRILPSSGVRQMLLDQFSASEALIDFAY
jgi:hypothetical protein